jgi:pimeloyl-ACP methyl ester carboxylesterase
MARPFSGSIPVDEERVRAIAGRAFDRTRDMAASQTNHWILEDPDSEPIRPRLGRITAPTLVIHGTEDPLFPLPHGEALAREIPTATLLPIDGMGTKCPAPGVGSGHPGDPQPGLMILFVG